MLSPKSCVSSPLARQEKVPPSWTLAAGFWGTSLSHPEPRSESRPGRGRLRPASPASQFVTGNRHGAVMAVQGHKAQEGGGGGTVEKLSTRELGRHTGQTQLSGSRVRGMGQPHSLSFHPWGAEAEGQLLRACLGLSSAEHKCRTSSGYINCLQATEPEGALCPRKRGSHPPPSGSPTPLRRKCLESA